MRIITAILWISCFTMGHAMDQDIKNKLVSEAAKARDHSYAPYSKFRVGASLLTADGTIYRGSNVENASYGLTCCAERIAIFKAVSDGHNEFTAIAIVVPGGGSPCGACRQVMNEFNPSMPVFYGDEEGNFIGETTLTELLPDAFGPHNLK